jgi:hypothetical protein
MKVILELGIIEATLDIHEAMSPAVKGYLSGLESKEMIMQLSKAKRTEKLISAIQFFN